MQVGALLAQLVHVDDLRPSTSSFDRQGGFPVAIGAGGAEAQHPWLHHSISDDCQARSKSSTGQSITRLPCRPRMQKWGGL